MINQQWGQRPVEELLNEANGALYAAKAEERNCVRVANPNSSSEDLESHIREIAKLPR